MTEYDYIISEIPPPPEVSLDQQSYNRELAKYIYEQLSCLRRDLIVLHDTITAEGDVFVKRDQKVYFDRV